MEHEVIRKRFAKALDTLVERIKQDRSVLAAVLCGSLSYDTVWDRSNIDLALVTIDDKRWINRGLPCMWTGSTSIHFFCRARRFEER